MTVHLNALLEPERCAVVVVDFQNDYCHPDGALARRGADVSATRVAAEKTIEFLAMARHVGAPCVHLRTEHSHWTDTPAWLSRGSAGPLLDVANSPVALAETWGAQPFHVEADTDDRVIIKHRYSGFAYTSLELSLRARGRETLLLAGVTSDTCVRATAFDALALGFVPVLLDDCTASSTAERHRQAVEEFAMTQGPVINSSAVRALWS